MRKPSRLPGWASLLLRPAVLGSETGDTHGRYALSVPRQRCRPEHLCGRCPQAEVSKWVRRKRRS